MISLVDMTLSFFMFLLLLGVFTNNYAQVVSASKLLNNPYKQLILIFFCTSVSVVRSGTN